MGDATDDNAPIHYGAAPEAAAPAAPAAGSAEGAGGPAAQPGGRRRKSRKSRKTRKSRKSRKGKKGKKSRKSRKGRGRKSRKSRKGRKHTKRSHRRTRRTRHRRRHRGGQNPVSKALAAAGAQFQTAVKDLGKLLSNDQARSAIIAQQGQLQAAKNQVAAATHSTYKALNNAAAQLAGKPGTGRLVGKLQQAANTQFMTRVPGMYPDHSFRRP